MRGVWFQAIIISMLMVLAGGITMASSSDLEIHAAYGNKLHGPDSASIYRGDSFNVSYEAESSDNFTAFMYVGQEECELGHESSLYSTEASLDEGNETHDDLYYSGALGMTIDSSDLNVTPGEYNICFVAYLTESVEMTHEIANLSLDVLNHKPYFDGLQSSYTLDEDDDTVAIVNLSDVTFDEDGDDLTYGLDTTFTDESVASCGVYNDAQGSIICDVNSAGSTSITVTANDGYDQVSKDVGITVEQVNDAPTFGDMPDRFVFDVSEYENAEVVDLADYAEDEEGDNLTFNLDTSDVNEDLADCGLRDGSVVFCDFTGHGGMTEFNVSVSDYEYTTTETVGLHLYNDTYVGEPVAVIDGPAHVSVGEQVTYNGSDSLGSFESEITDYEWTVNNKSATGETFDVTFMEHGSYDVSLTVTDANGKTDTETMVVTAGEDAQVIIDAPDEVAPGETFTLDGSRSRAASGLSITDYEWTIETPSGTLVDTLSGETVDYSLSVKRNYDITLEITDSTGHTTEGVHALSVVEPETELSDYGAEDGLRMMSYSVYGNDFETVVPDRTFVASTNVRNDAGVDLDNVRFIFSIPEIGVKFKSSGVDLEDGERKSITIQERLPYFVEPGVYYPRIALSNDEIRRVKYGYLEVVEE